MKKNTMLSTVLAAMLLASTGGAYAESHLMSKDVKLVKRASKKIELRINQPQVGKLHVELKNEEGANVYAGMVENGENVVKLFDLNALPNGIYTLNCSNDIFWSSQQLSIKNGEINIEPATYEEITAPSIEQYATNRFKVNTTNATTKVSIYKLNGELVYEGSLSAGNHFDLNRLTTGQYRFEFNLNDIYFSKFVRVK